MLERLFDIRYFLYLALHDDVVALAHLRKPVLCPEREALRVPLVHAQPQCCIALRAQICACFAGQRTEPSPVP